MVRDASSAAGKPVSDRQPIPVRRCRSRPARKWASTSTSPGSARANSAPSTATLALRDPVAATCSEAATTSENNMAPSYPPAPTL